MRTEERLRDVLETLAEQVDASPDAHRRAQAEWRRRERRRRIVVAVLAATVIAAANGAALWALNTGTPDAHIVENTPTAPPAAPQIPGQP